MAYYDTSTERAAHTPDAPDPAPALVDGDELLALIKDAIAPTATTDPE